MSDTELAFAWEALRGHPQKEALSAFVNTALRERQRAGTAKLGLRKADLSFELPRPRPSTPAKVPDAGPETTTDEAKTEVDETPPAVDLVRLLEEGPNGSDRYEVAVARALAALALADELREHGERSREAIGDALGLAGTSAFDATALLDQVFDGDDGWNHLADRLRARDTEGAFGPARAEALLIASAFAASKAPRAIELGRALSLELADPLLAVAVVPRAVAKSTPRDAETEPLPPREPAPGPGATPLDGELVPAPRSPLATALLGLTGLLFVWHGTRFLLRVALSWKRPATVLVSKDGVRIETRTLLLGRTLMERTIVLPRVGLGRVAREVRYPMLAFYTGLFALAVGSWFGVWLFVDGVRAASPSLLGTGFLVAALGIGIDFALASLEPSARGRCRLLFTPQRGARLCVAAVDRVQADALLASVM